MKYLLLYAGDETAAGLAPPTGSDAVAEDVCGPWYAEIAVRDVRSVAGGRLLPTATATTVRAAGDEILLADGPFAETKEQILGFDVIECTGPDDAIFAASRHPVAQSGGTVEVRPFLGGA